MARVYARRKYKTLRKEFKNDMRKLLKENRSLGMAIFNTYIAQKHRSHIHNIWSFLGKQYKDAWKGYTNSGLSGKMLSGDESFYKTIYFCGYEDICKKYRFKLPERIAFGEIYGMVIRCINGKEVY